MEGSDNHDMVPTKSDNSPDLIIAAQRLRDVRTACRRFLMLWAMSPAKEAQARIRQASTSDKATDDPEALLRALSNPKNRDWSLLYRGDVLDD
jgi:hypothetical protein